jgi:hypothetical protein
MTISEDIETLKNRNLRVEADKAWETSRFRKFCIMVITYLVAMAVMAVLGSQKPYFDALIPVLGFFYRHYRLDLQKLIG